MCSIAIDRGHQRICPFRMYLIVSVKINDISPTQYRESIETLVPHSELVFAFSHVQPTPQGPLRTATNAKTTAE